MAGLNVYDSRRPVTVEPYTGAVMKYGFLTNVKASVSAELGHEAPTGVTVVFGANAPKPGKATKRDATGSTSSYYDISLRASLRAAGWRTSSPKIRTGRKTRHTETAYITINGVKYAWQMPDWKKTKLAADFAALGIQTGTAADKDLVFGARTIGGAKPPRAQKLEVGVDGEDSISTIYDPSVTLPAGWGALIESENGN